MRISGTLLVLVRLMLQRLKTWLGRAPFFRAVSTGEQGEWMAGAFLQKNGYVVVARNWRSPRDRRDELDLVCWDGGVLVFVEVKTRAANALVSGYHAVDERKKAVVRRAATVYMRQLRPRPQTYRFDVVEVSVVTQGAPEVRHYENVELFPKHFRP